ncbi:ABC transporter ATP-binding protein [Candidatus Berkelbacteria bacterium]|nr:ABC transporter ATP-binding protein [Candidatus Berkelbacteria bacterium]
MRDVMITIEKLGKQYQLGERAQPYYTLRDALGGPLRRRTTSRKQNEFWALKDVSFEVGKGEVVGVIGRNGAGKSTLLKILSKITPPTSGQVTLRGRVASLLEVGTGFHPELTGRENVYLNGSILGMTQREIRAKFDEIVQFAEIEEFLDTPVKRYSSGMYVRLAFAVAAHLEPEILLVDEVLAVGDVQFQKKCLEKMEEITRGTGRTILFVSHNMGAIEDLCSRCVLLDHGRIQRIGDTPDVVNEYLKETHVADLADRRDRQGTGSVRLTRIAFIDRAGRATDSFKHGEPMSIAITYESHEPELRDIVIGLSFDSNTGHRIADISTLSETAFPKRVPGRGQLLCHLPSLPYNYGRYYVTGIVRYQGDIADWVRQAGFFDVEHGSSLAGKSNLALPWGSLIPPHEWELKKR